MKKALIFLSAVLFCVTALTAQQFKVEKSEVFDEPSNGWNKVFQLKNGNTFFFHGAHKEGLTITVYDKQRKIIATKELESKLWDVDDITDADISGLYEISGEPVLFIYQSGNMYRIRLNPNDGTVVNEEDLGSFGDRKGSRTWATVEKDPASDCYAVALIGFESIFSYDQQIRICHFDGNHKMISEATYPMTGAGFKYVRLSKVLVDGNKCVYLLMHAANSKPEVPSTRFKIVVSRLNAGAKVFTHKTLKMNMELEDPYLDWVFNRKLNKIQLIIVSVEDSKKQFGTGKITKYYSTLLTYIDPETMSVTGIKPMYGQKVSAYAQSHIDKNYQYSGVTSGMFVNYDNTTTIAMEEYRIVETKQILGAIGISELNDTGAETAGYAINKEQVTQGAHSILHQNDKLKNKFSFPSSNIIKNAQFMSFDYVAAPKANYVIFNDLADNFENDEDESKSKKMSAASVSNAVCYRLNGDAIDRSFLFGEPKAGSSTFCFINGSDYNTANNTYATIMIERDGRNKQSRIAWVTFE